MILAFRLQCIVGSSLANFSVCFSNMIVVRSNLGRIKENELCVWGRRGLTDHKYKFRPAERHMMLTTALFWPAGSSEFRLHLLIYAMQLALPANHCPLELSQKAVHAGCHCRGCCLNELTGCDVRGTNAPQEELELIADPCLSV